MIEAIGVHRVYRGPHGSAYLNRGISRCEAEWNKEPGLVAGTLDELLSSQMTRGVLQGQTNFTVVDIGAGNGEFLKRVVQELAGDTNLGNLQMTKSFLRLIPELKLNFLGLTDIDSPEELGKRTPIGSANANPGQVEAFKVGYPLAFTQPFDSFLAQQKIDSVDLVLGTCSFMYFHPKLMIEVLEDSLKYMQPGARLVAAGYSMKNGDLLSRNNNIDNQATGQISVYVKEFYRLSGSPELDIDGIIENNQLLKRKMRRGYDLFPIEEVNKLLIDMGEHPLRMLVLLSAGGIELMEKNYYLFRASLIHKNKLARLSLFKEHHQEDAEVQFGNQTIIIDKK